MRGWSRSGSFLLLLLLGTLTLTLARADEVILKNGGAIQGRIVSEDEQKVVVETKAGKVTIERARIREVVRSQARPQRPEPATPTPDAPATPTPATSAATRVLVLVAFEGADPPLVAEVARRVGRALGAGVRVEARDARLKPDERDAIDHRATRLPEMARSMRLDPGGTLEELEARLRAALRADPRPEVQRYEALVDDACSVRLSVVRLEAQVASLAGDSLRAPGVIGVIGVTNRDISAPDMNFLFGHADRATRAGVISYLRFADGGARDVITHRAAVQALSTTGVLLGLGRCEEVTCARAFPKNLEEHDRKQEQFCAACRRVVDAALAPR